MVPISPLQLRLQAFPVRTPSEDARQYAYRMIRTCILELLLLPGQKMNEADIASSLNMSRTPVHDSFFKLSRENLADIIPNRGAFISKLSQERIKEAVWLHTRLGDFMLQSIYIRKVPGSRMEALYQQLDHLRDLTGRGELTGAAGILTEYYRQLYLLAGNMEHIWSSLQKADADLRRLLCLAAASPAALEGLQCELTDLADALSVRDHDRASMVYENHMSRLLLLAAPLQSHYPQYFTSSDQ